MPDEARGYLIRQLDTAWKLTNFHLDGLTTEECLWRPAHQGLHVLQVPDGRWRADWPDHEGYDVGPPDVSGRSWVRAMTLVAVAYVVIGIVFGALAASADPNHVRLWRLAAWVASAAVAAAQIGYEHYRLGSSPRPTALHAAGAVALGAFGLAVAANVHWLFAATRGQHSPLLALVAWPVITALPAFIVALAVAAVLARFSRRA